MKTIFLVDDDEIFIVVAKATLSKIFPQATFVTAANGEEAMAKLKTTIPDILFLDINMPIMGGKEFLAELSKQYIEAPFPVVIATSSIDPKDFNDTGKHPFVAGFIEKPLKRERIEAVLISMKDKDL